MLTMELRSIADVVHRRDIADDGKRFWRSCAEAQLTVNIRQGNQTNKGLNFKWRGHPVAPAEQGRTPAGQKGQARR
jgi:hypothetical protein